MNLLNKFKISLPPLPTAPPPHTPQRATLLQLSVVVLVAVLAHIALGHPVIAGFGVLVWIMKFTSIVRRAKVPPRWLVMLLTIMSFLLVLLFYGGWNGQKAGISFLVLLASLKFLESQSLRDYYMVCLILFFLASSSFLFDSSLLSIFGVVLYTVAILALMLRLSDPHQNSSAKPLLGAAGIVLKALPLAVLLFFFFPRIHGNFGFIPSQDELGGESQINDSMVAGDFANSAFSNEPAFRVEFDGPTPPNSLLYWRVKVMANERNFAWEVSQPTPSELERARSKQGSANAALITELEAGLIHYQVVHEPSDDSYAPYLDYAYQPENGAQLANYSVLRDQKRNGIFSYRGSASQTPHLAEPKLANRNRFLTTMSVPSARSLALLKNWRQQARNDADLINLVLQYYRANNFVYTLAPPGLGSEPLDMFLFETRAGYCEHYASSFTILMRWLGIPARVVVGFQGGKKNPVGGYLQVKYSDAHAWSEVWIDNRWHRVDPTSVSSIGEQRIEQGMDALLSLWENGEWRNWQSGSALADYLNPGVIERTLRRLQDNWDNLGHQWDKWVVNYDFAAQSKLLANLGLEHRNSLYTLLAVMAVGTFALMLFYFWQLIPTPIRIGEAQQAYLKFLRYFKAYNVLKQPAETPLEFAQRAKAKLPNDAETIDAITRSYVELRYGRHPGSIADFVRLVNTFQPNRKPSTLATQPQAVVESPPETS